MLDKKPISATRSRLVAWTWLIVCVIALIFDMTLFSGRHLSTDLFALLPQQTESLAQTKAREAMLLKAQNELLIMAGIPTSQKADFLPTLQSVKAQWTQSLPFEINELSTDDAIHGTTFAHAPHLTLQDEETLKTASDSALLAWAFSQATTVGQSALVPFAQDPLGLYSRWLTERSEQTPLRPQDGFLTLETPEYFWALMRFDVDTVVAMDRPLNDAIDHFKSALITKVPNARVLATGVPLFTNVAATTAQKELTLIGTVSTIGVLGLAWYWFSSVRTIAAILAITLSAMGCALAMTFLLCGQVHLVTMVFGMSLIGITVDYSAHYFCRRFGCEETEKSLMIRALRNNLGLALLSTSIAFAMMAFTPLPGLQQMATFCVTGLIAAFIGVFAWLPHFDRHARALPPHIPALEALFQRMPTWNTLFGHARWIKFTVVLTVSLFIALGLGRLQYSADIRDLNHFHETLIKESAEIQTLTQIPSTTQYFLIEANTLEDLLLKEEALKRQWQISSIKDVSLMTLSDWVASNVRQKTIFTLKQNVIDRLNPTIEALLGAPLQSIESAYLTPQAFLATPQGEAFKGKVFSIDNRWIGIVSVIGLNADNVQAVSHLASGLEGVQWVNTTESLSNVLSHYRTLVTTFLSVGLALIVLIVSVRFKKDAWRACLPTILGLLLTAAILGWLGHPVSLFTVLAGILLLGLGIDYGIFLTANPRDHRTLVAVAFAALTTFMAFGLLAFSATPALHTFGLAIAIGQCLIWILTPLWRKF